MDAGLFKTQMTTVSTVIYLLDTWSSVSSALGSTLWEVSTVIPGDPEGLVSAVDPSLSSQGGEVSRDRMDRTRTPGGWSKGCGWIG